MRKCEDGCSCWLLSSARRVDRNLLRLDSNLRDRFRSYSYLIGVVHWLQLGKKEYLEFPLTSRVTFTATAVIYIFALAKFRDVQIPNSTCSPALI